MYADNLFGMTLMKRLTKEGNNIICADKTLAEINNKIATHSYNLDYSDSVDEIFRIHNLEGVIFIGDTLIDGSVPHSNGEFLEKALDLCEKYKVKQQRQKEKRERNVPFPLDLGAIFLLEVTIQQTLQGNTVASLVTSHLVDGLQNAAFQAAYLQGAWMAFLYWYSIISQEFTQHFSSGNLWTFMQLWYKSCTSPNIFLTSLVQF